MKNNIKNLALTAVVAAAFASIALSIPSARAQGTSAPAGKQWSPVVDGIELPPGTLTFNWGISNKVIRPK